ncbi:polymorphic toxin-type HINT domain-containing protein [Planctomyces sp. SH-PL62]|uniref:polymorphic toxin-type HINT domain-containing protein n=1 Tax=Planctomyces sp. SH-PL62 TaxID=1636152 RepID=UPI00078D9728|nr:polymorphic toxin-type HINT domain-containing protein [Planctomyces sp. SH-PL62]AMV38051.1 hypothetical protein VT85_11480 [Planctomyces sp. SH-PL62]
MISAWVLSAAVGFVGGVDREEPGRGVDRAAYEAAKAAAGRDADAQVRLALWCEAQGLAAEKTTHLTRAVLLAPDHARARGLLGYVERDGKWMRPAEAARAVEESPEQQALFREYLERRAKTRDQADDLYKLALWCGEKGLAQPMTAHLVRVVQLDPGREGAWRRLGFEKSKGRWVHPEAEAAAQAAHEARERAEKEWKPRLEKIRSGLASRDKAKRAEAREALAAIEDPRAVPSLWRSFARGGDEGRQRIAVEVFGRIDGPGASAALATLAVFSPHATARSEASALLVRRDPRDFAGLLASWVRDEVKYKVKPVGGPGSQGELLVEGRDAKLRRLYTPMQPPQLTDWRGLPSDPSGVSTIDVSDGYTGYSGPIMSRDLVPALAAQKQRYQAVMTLNTPNPQLNAAFRNFVDRSLDYTVPGGVSYQPWSVMFSPTQLANELGRDSSESNLVRLGGPNFREVVATTKRLHVPIDAMIAEARASASVAREQMTRDVADIEAYNAPIREVNERAATLLKEIGGVDLGYDREKWMDWAYELEGRGYARRSASAEPTVPTYVEDVPIAFTPQARPYMTVSFSVAGYTPSGYSCFAGGTPVRTLRGDRPIETIRPGDQVLTQDTTTGRFDYRAVVTVFHNPPTMTHAIDLGRETVHPTGIHRFWKAGHGWVMARDLKPGDRLRTVGGTVEVASAEKEKVQPVFNLLLSGGDNYCVGSLGLIAHDNGFVEPVAAPFDGVPATAELVATRKP